MYERPPVCRSSGGCLMSDPRHDRDQSAGIAARRTRRGKPSMGEIADASEPWAGLRSPAAAPDHTLCPAGQDDPRAAPFMRADGSAAAYRSPPVREPRTDPQTIKPPRATDAKSLTIRLHPSTSRLLRHLAIRRSCTIADIVRSAVNEHLIGNSLPGMETLDGMSTDEIDQLALTVRSSPT